MRRACHECEFWVEDPETITTGFCHRFPPTVVGDDETADDLQSAFPSTRDGDWCGEFKITEQDLLHRWAAGYASDGVNKVDPERFAELHEIMPPKG